MRLEDLARGGRGLSELPKWEKKVAREGTWGDRAINEDAAGTVKVKEG